MKPAVPIGIVALGVALVVSLLAAAAARTVLVEGSGRAAAPRAAGAGAESAAPSTSTPVRRPAATSAAPSSRFAELATRVLAPVPAAERVEVTPALDEGALKPAAAIADVARRHEGHRTAFPGRPIECGFYDSSDGAPAGRRGSSEEATLTVLLTDDRGEPVPRIGVRFDPPLGEDDDALAWHRTNDDGELRVRVDPDRPMAVSTVRVHDEVPPVLASVPPIERGESVVLDLYHPAPPRVDFHALVVDGDGESVPGARVRLSLGKRIATDDDGRFELNVAEWDGVHASVAATGHGRAAFAVESGHERPADALVIELPAPASLEVLVRGGDAAFRRVQARAQTAPAGVATGRVQLGGHVLDAWMDADGRGVLTPLDPDVAYTVHVDGGEAAPDVVLAGGEQRRLVLTLRP